MGLSKHLQSPEILQKVSGMNPDELRTAVLEMCRKWYDLHPEEGTLIRTNLERLGISSTEKQFREIEHHIFLHYYEKFLPHIKTPQEYHSFLREQVDCQEAVGQLETSLSHGNGILLVTAHFGSIEFLIPGLSMHKSLPLNTAVRFTTERFSQQMHGHARNMHDSGYFSLVHILEIGKPGMMIALEMLKVLRRKEILFSVFDERTPYSVPVKLFGRDVWGGAGLDKLLNSCNEPVALYTIYAVRTGENTHQLKLFEIDTSRDPIQGIYDSLETIVNDHLEQWYFLHEEIPFVEE